MSDLIEVDGLRVAVTRVGTGPALAFLGGFVGDGKTTWRRQIEDFSRSYTVVTWDAPGSGGSSDVPESFRLTDYARCLAGVISSMRLEPLVLIGLSFGGALAIEYYRDRADSVRGLFLAGAYAGWAGSLPPDVATARLEASRAASLLSAADFVSALMPTMFSASAPPERITGFAYNMAATFRPAGFRAMAAASAEADLRDVLPTVNVPTVVLHGDADVRAPRDVADALVAAIPSARLVVLPGVGHVSPVEAPESFTAELRAFLRDLPP